MKDNNPKIVIIGSGLSAYASILSALDLKVKVTVLDIGAILPAEITLEVSKIRKGEPGKVYLSLADLSKRSGEVKLGTQEMPKKTLYGSQYFYEEELLGDQSRLPFSEALGGYSVAWGGAALPPAEGDLPRNTINYPDLVNSIQTLAKYISLPFIEDSLTNEFPNYGDKTDDGNIILSNSQRQLLNRLTSIQNFDKDDTLIVGQSRLLTKVSGPRSCQYCGMCSHGCIYNSIFSSESEIKELANSGRIDYFSGRKVLQVRDYNDEVRIEALNLASGLEETFEADYAFVAAGAVNSTKIAIKSFGLEKEEVRFQKTGGFVRPYFSVRKVGLDWPRQNTQANIFMEIKDVNLSKFWIHSQVSTPNEIVILGLGYLNSTKLMRLLSPLRNFFLRHLILVMTNLHSEEGPFYDLKTVPFEDAIKFDGVLRIPKTYLQFEKRVEAKIKRKFRRMGFLAIPFTKKGVSNGPGYHVGGSMPIGGEGKLSTDTLGRFDQNSKISFVDTSVLPCIPATTIGLFAMANSHRITTKVLKLKLV